MNGAQSLILGGVGHLSEICWWECYPTLAAKTIAPRGWGTQMSLGRKVSQSLALGDLFVGQAGVVDGAWLDGAGYEGGAADDHE